jgi:predicted RecB family endonuclease
VIALPGEEAAANLTAELGTEMLPVDDLTDLFLAAVGHDAEAAGGLLSQELTAATEPSGTMLDPAADARANELATKTRLILGITGR